MPKPAAATTHERRPGSLERTDKAERAKSAAKNTTAHAANGGTPKQRDERPGPGPDRDSDSDSGTPSSLFQPRVAVLLDVPKNWHPVLFASRALACAPAVWWGAPSALLLVLRVALQLGLLKGDDVGGQVVSLDKLLDARLGFTESALAVLWVRISWLAEYGSHGH